MNTSPGDICACLGLLIYHFKIYYVSGDLGGYLGLLLGASIVTVCEVLDLIVYNALRIYLDNKQKRMQSKMKSGGSGRPQATLGDVHLEYKSSH